MPSYDIVGYVALNKHPDIVTGIILEENETKVKLKMSVESARELYLNNQINVPKEEVVAL